MKKICMIMSDTLSYQTLSIEHLVKLKIDKKCQVDALYGGDYARIANSLLDEYANFVDVKIVRKPSLLRDIVTLSLVTRHLFFNRYDSVVFSTPKAMLIGSIASFITLQPRRVCIVRGRAYEGFHGLKRKLFMLLDLLTFKLSTDVFFISNSLKNSYLKDIKFINSSVVANGSSKGVDSSRFKPLSSDEFKVIRKKFGFSSSDYIITSVGRMCFDKGISDLEAIIKSYAERGSNVKFLLVGEVEDIFAEKFLASNYENVTHVLYLKNIELAFQISNLNLFLSHREGFGNVAIEAAACNVKTIGYDVVGVTDSITEPITGYKIPFNRIDLVIERVDSEINNYYRKEVNKDISCRTFVIEKFDSDFVCDSYIQDVYLGSV